MTIRTLLLCALLISGGGFGCATDTPRSPVPSWTPTRDDGTPIPDPRGMEDVPVHPTRPI